MITKLKSIENYRAFYLTIIVPVWELMIWHSTVAVITDVIQKYNVYVITNVTDVTHLIKTILKQSNTSFKLPIREWNDLIIHIIEKF